jgi:hypothetical protein
MLYKVLGIQVYFMTENYLCSYINPYPANVEDMVRS